MCNIDDVFSLNMGFSCVLCINSVLVIYFARADICVNKNIVNKKGVELAYTTELKDWTLTEESRFQLYYGMHLDDCVIECGLRQHCDHLTYNAHMQLCELFKARGNGKKQSKQRHWIHVLKQDINVTKTPCGDECNATEACDWKAVTPRCTYKECIDFPTLENGRILGNAHGIGSKIRFKCNYGWTPDFDPSSVCGDNGNWTPIGTCLGCALGQDCSSDDTYCCTQNNAECMDQKKNRKTCECQGEYYQKGDVCVKKIETGQPCPVRGLNEFCLHTNDICELDSPGEKARPKCVSKLCDATRCTEVNNTRCVIPNDSRSHSKCYCKPGYEFNETLEICVEFCKNYSTNGTTFERRNHTAISEINLGKICAYNFDECVEYCNTNHSAYLSINYHYHCNNPAHCSDGCGNSCVCNKLSLRQYNITEDVPTCTFYDRACKIYP